MTNWASLFECAYLMASRMVSAVKMDDEGGRFCILLAVSVIMAYPAPVSVFDPSV